MSDPRRSVTFVVSGLPVTEGNLVLRLGRIVHKGTTLAAWRRCVSVAGLQARGRWRPRPGPIRLVAVFFLPPPRAIPAERLGYPCVRPDLDKLMRAIGDGLTGVFYVDDGQIVEAMLYKRYGEPRAEITINELT